MCDEDGHKILDFWQGHLANVLGHNPEVVTSELAQAFANGFGLQTGIPDRLQSEVAEILCRQTGVAFVRRHDKKPCRFAYTPSAGEPSS